MTATPRFDLYRPIHQALRAALTGTLVRLGALDVEDSAERRSLLTALDALLALMDSHLQHEECFLHPLLHAAQPLSVAGIEQEHATHRVRIAHLRAHAATVEVQGSDAAAYALYLAFARFVAESFEHMHDEETRLNALLWAHFSDDELAQVHGRLVGSIPPTQLLATLRFMLPALNPLQRAGLMCGMPPEAMPPALQIAAEVLDVSGYARLRTVRAKPPPRHPDGRTQRHAPCAAH